MSNEPLPRTLDVRRAAARGATVRGLVQPVDLPRFRTLLAADEGAIEVVLSLSRDEENRYLANVSVRAEVTVTCQRCLEPMPIVLTGDTTLGVVWREAQAAQLPRQLDPLVVEGEACDLWELVEEELILSLPAFSYHDTQQCRDSLAGFAAPPPEEDGAGPESPNPFEVLGQLKPRD